MPSGQGPDLPASPGASEPSCRIGAHTRLFGILGHPLGHTLSPALHNAAFAAAGVDAVYLALPVVPDALAGAIAGVRAWRVGGLSVTVPHKVAVIDLLDGLTAEARAAGAVNTLLWQGGRLMGHNTDIAGYQAMLRVAGQEAASAVILGAGGSARAVGVALRQAGMRVAVAARNLGQAQALAAELGEPVRGVGLAELADPAGVLSAADLIVNCTPVGMMPAADASPLDELALSRLPAHAVVHDLVYRPLETRLLALAKARGLRTVDGGVMLVAQAAVAFAAWTGLEAPQALMESVFAKAIRELS